MKYSMDNGKLQSKDLTPLRTPQRSEIFDFSAKDK
jgi:hypothetical protein